MTNVRNIVAETARQRFFRLKSAVLEPDLIERPQFGTFSYSIAANKTKIILSSWDTNLETGAGRVELRSAANPWILSGGPSGLTLTGNSSGSGAIILDPDAIGYGDPESVFYERMAALDSLQLLVTKFTGGAAISGADFLPGPYGSIIRQVTCFDNPWIAIHYAGTTTAGIGFPVQNEISDTALLRLGDLFLLPMSRVACTGVLIAAGTLGKLSFSYNMLPRTWSKVPDPVQAVFTAYTFYDDFLAGLDTSVKWNTPVQSTGGNVAVIFSALKVVGNANWNTNGIVSKYSAARADQRTFVADYITTTVGSGCYIGWNTGADVAENSFAHGILFGLASALKVHENANDRGAVGAGWTIGYPYRVKISVLSGGGATYGIQGGSVAENYAAIGSSTWTDITPATSSSVTNTLYPAFSAYSGTNFFNIPRVY